MLKFSNIIEHYCTLSSLHAWVEMAKFVWIFQADQDGRYEEFITEHVRGIVAAINATTCAEWHCVPQAGAARDLLATSLLSDRPYRPLPNEHLAAAGRFGLNAIP